VELPGRLAVISCFFNPCGYRVPRENYLRFSDQLALQNIPHYSIELAFDCVPFFLTAGPTLLQYRTSHVLWHKERLLNLILSYVPKEFDKIAWVDTDVLFADPSWADCTSKLLEQYPIVQLFDSAVFLGKTGQPLVRIEGVASTVSGGGRLTDRYAGHTGLAWAARRSLLSRHGFHDIRILGGGDSDMVVAMYGKWDDPYLDDGGPVFREHRLAWMMRFAQDVAGHVGYVPSSVFHLWHGPIENRQYLERSRLLAEYRFDPASDVRQTPEGLWEWTGTKPELEQKVRMYFIKRREDE
jgi:hypothetical protein